MEKSVFNHNEKQRVNNSEYKNNFYKSKSKRQTKINGQNMGIRKFTVEDI